MKCSTLLRNQKYKTEEFQASCTQNTTEKWYLIVLFTSSINIAKINLYKIVLKVDIFHHLCCSKLEFQIKNLVQLQ